MSYTDDNLGNDSSFGGSELDDTQNGLKKVETALQQIYMGLERCAQIYKDKEEVNNEILKRLGCTSENIDADLKQQLHDIFSENEVFDFADMASREKVRINPCHVLDRMVTDDYLSMIQRLKSQVDRFLDDLILFQANVQQKQNAAINESEMLKQKTAVYKMKRMNFTSKLEHVQKELDSLKNSYENMEKSKYTVEELSELHKRNKHLDEEIALNKVKLEKYHNLPLNENDAARELAKLKSELMMVTKEIMNKNRNLY